LNKSGLRLTQASFIALDERLARLLSLLLAVGLVYLIYACGREVLSKRAAIFAAQITALADSYEGASPFFRAINSRTFQ
jgi:uncharacterized membrane protein